MRHVRSILMIVFVAALVISCGLVVKGCKELANNGKITATVPAPALMAETSPLPEMTATATSTEIPQPTVDTRYLAPKMTEAEIGRIDAQSAQVAADAQSTVVSNHATEAAIQAGTPTAQAITEATLQAVQTQKSIIGMTETPAHAQFMAGMATATQQAKTEQRKDAQDFAWQIFVYLIVACGIIAVLVIGTQYILFRMHQAMYPTAEAQESQYDTNQADGDELPQTQPMVAHLHTDQGAVKRIPAPLVADEIFRQWVERVTTGDSAAIDMWETAESPFKGRLYRDYFYPWLVKNNMLTRGTDGRTVLSSIGQDYCNEWKARHTHRPIQLDTPKETLIPTVHTENGYGKAEGEAPKGEKEG